MNAEKTLTSIIEERKYLLKQSVTITFSLEGYKRTKYHSVSILEINVSCLLLLTASFFSHPIFNISLGYNLVQQYISLVI